MLSAVAIGTRLCSLLSNQCLSAHCSTADKHQEWWLRPGQVAIRGVFPKGEELFSGVGLPVGIMKFVFNSRIISQVSG